MNDRLGECFENKWFYMKYIGKYLSAEILLPLKCIYVFFTLYGRNANIVKISLKRVEMNFCPGSKNSILGKTAKYDRIINELCHFYKKKQPSSRVEKINMLKRALISL
jgi:hypothetical protein